MLANTGFKIINLPQAVVPLEILVIQQTVCMKVSYDLLVLTGNVQLPHFPSSCYIVKKKS
jgi:hypothetical protein